MNLPTFSEIPNKKFFSGIDSQNSAKLNEFGTGQFSGRIPSTLAAFGNYRPSQFFLETCPPI